MSPFQFPTLAGQILPAFPGWLNKKPLTTHGFKDATTDLATFAKLARGFKDFLIGVPTGKISGFDVLDIDPEGHDWLKEQNPLFTRWHRTQRGGYHFLFKHRPGTRNSESKIAPGVDVRGDGGYMIWWPSTGLQISNEGELAE